MSLDHEVKSAGLTAAIGGGGFTLTALTLQDWVAVLTIVLLLGQFFLILPRLREQYFPKKEKQ